MREGLQVGAVGELLWVVDPTMTITLGSLPQATVFSTPNMILLMERAAREALRPFLEAGEESVGVAVSTNHTGPALLGQTVRGIAQVTAVDGRRIHFSIRCFAGEREIGHGEHTRAVVALDRLTENLVKLRESEGNQMNLQTSTGELPALQTLRVDVIDRVATVTLLRPRVRNAMDVRMTTEWEQLNAWLAGHGQDVRVVIITGDGSAFCAGDDVKEIATLSVDEARQLSLRQANLLLAFERLPQTVIAAVNGPALGAGCILAASCDFRLASHAATFGMPEIRLGWPPGYGIAQLTALVGKARTLELCLTGDAISAATAESWGLVHQVVPGNRLTGVARELAQRLLKLPSEALRATKQLIHSDEGQLPKVTHRADTEAYVRCFATEDARSALRAFVNKG